MKAGHRQNGKTEERGQMICKCHSGFSRMFVKSSNHLCGTSTVYVAARLCRKFISLGMYGNRRPIQLEVIKVFAFGTLISFSPGPLTA